MVYSCCVVGCTNRFQKGSGMGFYRFPANIERRNIWCHMCRRKNWVPSKGTRICSRHFKSGRPSKLRDYRNPDWAPSLNLGYTLKGKPSFLKIIQSLKSSAEKREKINDEPIVIRKKQRKLFDPSEVIVKPYQRSNFEKWCKEQAKQRKENSENNCASTTYQPQVIKLSCEMVDQEIETSMSNQITKTHENDQIIRLKNNRLNHKFKKNEMTEIHDYESEDGTDTCFQILPTPELINSNYIKVESEGIKMKSEDAEIVKSEDTKIVEFEDIEMVELEDTEMLEDLDNTSQMYTNLAQSSGEKLSPECHSKNMRWESNKLCRALEEISTKYSDLQEREEDVDTAFCNLIKRILQNVSYKNRRNIQKKILTTVKEAIELL